MYPDGRTEGARPRDARARRSLTSRGSPLNHPLRRSEALAPADVTGRACGGLACALHTHPTTMSAADSVLFPAVGRLAGQRTFITSSKVRLPPPRPTIFIYAARENETHAEEKERHFLLRLPLPCDGCM